MTRLTPQEWQDIERAKAAMRIDAGWHESTDAAAAAADASAPANVEPAASGDGVPDAGPNGHRADAGGSRAPRPRVAPTPEANGFPTAG